MFGKSRMFKWGIPLGLLKKLVQTLHSESEEETVPIQHAIVALGMVPWPRYAVVEHEAVWEAQTVVVLCFCGFSLMMLQEKPNRGLTKLVGPWSDSNGCGCLMKKKRRIIHSNRYHGHLLMIGPQE